LEFDCLADVSAVEAEDICHWQQLMQHLRAAVAALEAPMWWQRV
jgi:hypothetical protein